MCPTLGLEEACHSIKICPIIQEVTYPCCVVLDKSLPIEVPDEVLDPRAHLESTWVHVDYEHPFLNFGFRVFQVHQIWTLPHSPRILLRNLKAPSLGPVLKIAALIEQHLLFLTEAHSHHPLFIRSVPEDFGIPEVLLLWYLKDWVALCVLDPSKPPIIGVGKVLILLNGPEDTVDMTSVN